MGLIQVPKSKKTVIWIQICTLGSSHGLWASGHLATCYNCSWNPARGKVWLEKACRNLDSVLCLDVFNFASDPLIMHWLQVLSFVLWKYKKNNDNQLTAAYVMLHLFFVMLVFSVNETPFECFKLPHLPQPKKKSRKQKLVNDDNIKNW